MTMKLTGCGGIALAALLSLLLWAVIGLVLVAVAHAREVEPQLSTGVACLSAAGCTSHPEILEDLQGAAADADVAPDALLGALNTLADAGIVVTPRVYLFPPPPPPPVVANGWPIGGALGQRLFCVESIESHHGTAMWNPQPVWNGEHAAGWLGFLPSTAQRWGVVIGNRVSEWSGAARMLQAGAGGQFYGISSGRC